MRKRTKVNLSNEKLFSTDLGALVPIDCRFTLPGDTFEDHTTALVRLSPLLAPMMTTLHARIFKFFVPLRLLWDNWEPFITGGPDGLNSDTIPKITFANGGVTAGQLADMLGIGDPAVSVDVNALPFRAYGKIWNEWFRDQDLQTEVTVSTANGPDNTTNTSRLFVAWDKDRFTTARPWPQKGGDTLIPMAADAPVTITPTGDDITVAQEGALGDVRTMQLRSSGNAVGYTGANFGAGADMRWIDAALEGEADLSGSPGTIRELREAVALDRFKMRMARAGSRYVDYNKNTFGVRSSDARLQRPELLSMSKQPVIISEVLQTAEGTDPVGELRGHGIMTARTNKYRRFFEEHGIVMTLFCAMPKTQYMNAQERHWFYTDRTDFYDPDIALIGEQEMLNAEVQAGHTTPQGSWGFNARYYEWRDALDSVGGEFKTTLNYWNLARDFGGDQSLNSTFVTGNPSNRIFAVTSTDQLYVKAVNRVVARRPIHRSSNPGIL